MKKFLELMRNKLFVSLVAVGLAVVIIGVSALSIMVPSYGNWKTGYDAILKEKEEQKYLQTLPLELLSITANLSDSVTYYANGKAAPENADFDVIANFTEKGKAFNEILKPDAFKISVPDGFSKSGGTVNVQYTFTPPAKDETAPAPEPVVKTADVACSLEKVMPVKVSLKEQPYRVFYSDAMAFEADGLKADLLFNDGSSRTVSAGEFTFAEDKLAAGVESVNGEWVNGGTRLSISVPVTVVAAKDYKEGRMLSIKTDGTVYVNEGALASTAELQVRAEYESGNRLLLDETEYEVRGNSDQPASYTRKYLISVFSRDDYSIIYNAAAVVRGGIEAENATLTGGMQGEEAEEFVYDGIEFTSKGNVNAVNAKNGAKMTFAMSSDAVSTPKLSMRLALKSDSVRLADVMTMTVNGRNVTIPRAKQATAPEGAEGKLIFSEIQLPTAVLNKTDANVIEFSFIHADASKLVIDRILLEAGFTETFYSSTEEYLVAHVNSSDVKFDNTIVKPFGDVSGKPYGHGICSDGTYLYIVATTWEEVRSLKVQKYNPVTNTVVAASANTENAAQEETAGITYYDNKIIIYFMDGRRMYVNVADFADGCVFKEYDGFRFEGLETARLNNVYYNAVKDTFAVHSGRKIFLYGKDMKKIIDFDAPDGVKRITGSDAYIYTIYTQDGVYAPNVNIYDWNGVKKGSLTIPVSPKFMTDNGVTNLTKTNVQGMAVVNGDFYVNILRFDNMNATAYVKVTMPAITEYLEPTLTYSEYLTACADAGVKPAFTASPTIGTDAVGSVEGTTGYSMGGASDGEYIYLVSNSHNGGGNNEYSVVYKVEPETFRVLATSSEIEVSKSVSGASPQDNSRLFVKGDTLYCVAGDVFSIPLDSFDDECVLSKDEAMTKLLSGNGERVLTSAYWSGAEQKYAVMDQTMDADGAVTARSLRILAAEGTQIGQTTELDLSASSVYGYGDTIYVSYNSNDKLNVDVFGWDCAALDSFSVTGFDSMPVGGFNIQAVYAHNGELHAVVCTWYNDATYHDWTVSGDGSVFNPWTK